MNYVLYPEDSIFENNILGDNIRTYRNVNIRNSKLKDNITIGDSSVLLDSTLSDYISIGRRNHVCFSHIGRFVYTGDNTTVFDVDLGNFCSISWDVSIGGGDHLQDRVTTSPLSRFFYFTDVGGGGYGMKKQNLKLEKNIKLLENVLLVMTFSFPQVLLYSEMSKSVMA